jgi:di/tricarboxylate transporter
LISSSEEVPSKRKSQAVVSLTFALAMIALVTFEVLPMVVASGVAAILLIVTRCINVREAFVGVEWGVLLSIGSSFGVAKALENAGVAQFLATQIVHIVSPFGIQAAIAGVYIATVVVTQIVTNNAAAAMLLPIGLSVASHLNHDYLPFAYAVTIGSSMAFATPIGYQTNMMVQGPGGYRFVDYLKIGLPLHLIVGVTFMLMIQYLFF